MKLEELSAALREEGQLDPERKRAVRARVLLRPKRRVRAVRWLLPVAAVLAGVTAWAGVRERWWLVSARAPEPELVTTTTPSPPPIVTVARPSVLVLPPPSASEAPVPSPVVRIAPPPPIDKSRLVLDAYRNAERLQFTSKDYAGALDAWDRYLAQANGGPLVVDARYDRALCLMHLGRKDEARDALAPFANAAPGTYRQAEAKALLESLR